MMRRALFAGFLLLALACASASQEISLEGIVCPGSTSLCPTDSTCCKMSEDEWGCCSGPDAVCCDDGKHCCGKGQKCTDGMCTSSLLSTPWLMKSEAKPMEPKESMPWLAKIPALEVGAESVFCDSSHYCPNGNTCCPLPSGQFACCPFIPAECCSDGIHCCPGGYTCDLTHYTCVLNQEGKTIAWSPMATKTLALQVGAESVFCDSSHYCPNGNTCCPLPSGQFACCPYIPAECCSDGIHCCPGGYTCDLIQYTCVLNQEGKTIAWSPMATKTLALQVGAESVFCDSSHYCPNGNTCCPLPSGQFACCPYIPAECCSDGIHCCPGGYTCDLTHYTCVLNQEGKTIAWSPMAIKTLALQVDVDVQTKGLN